METGKYTMNINAPKKELQFVIIGNFDEATVKRFFADYDKHVARITPSDYTLRLDCTDIAVVTPDLIPSFEGCYSMYKQTGFKKIVFELSDKPIVKMQLSRVARKVGLTNAEFVQK